MGSEVKKGIKFTWYEPEPGVPNSGGLGIMLERRKKTRRFYAVLPAGDVRKLRDYLSGCLKEK